LSKAELLDVETKNAQIRELEKEIKQLKKGSSLWSKLGKKITTLSDDLLKED
jgi:cell division protein FtsA